LQDYSPIGFFMEDPETNPEQFIDELVAAGRVAEKDRARVLLVRWLTKAESELRGGTVGTGNQLN
jgi:hypothetical protein